MFYDLFCDLCKQRGVSVTKATIDIGLSRTIGTKWKRTGATPNGETLQKIADYFGVSTDYLLGTETEKAPTPESGRKLDYDIYRIQRAKARMPEEEWNKQMRVIEASFGDYFSDDYVDVVLDE